MFWMRHIARPVSDTIKIRPTRRGRDLQPIPIQQGKAVEQVPCIAVTHQGYLPLAFYLWLVVGSQCRIGVGYACQRNLACKPKPSDPPCHHHQCQEQDRKKPLVFHMSGQRSFNAVVGKHGQKDRSQNRQISMG
ncbi:hypothetical protein D3C71_1587370 [compost metagenome]